jgi:hypothetical protein
LVYCSNLVLLFASCVIAWMLVWCFIDQVQSVRFTWRFKKLLIEDLDQRKDLDLRQV